MTEKNTRTPSDKIVSEVLAAAVIILDTEGPDGFTVRNIAEQAGVAPMAIYNHFENVNGLLEVLWIDGFERLTLELNVTTGNPDADLHSAGHAYRRFALNNRGLYTVMFLHRFKNFDPSTNASYIAAQTFQAMVSKVELIQQRGAFRGIEASDGALIMWSVCHGYVALELLGINFATDRDAIFDHMLTIMHEGFR